MSSMPKRVLYLWVGYKIFPRNRFIFSFSLRSQQLYKFHSSKKTITSSSRDVRKKLVQGKSEQNQKLFRETRVNKILYFWWVFSPFFPENSCLCSFSAQNRIMFHKLQMWSGFFSLCAIYIPQFNFFLPQFHTWLSLQLKNYREIKYQIKDCKLLQLSLVCWGC